MANELLMKIPPEAGMYWKKAQLDLLSAFIPEALSSDMTLRASLLLSFTDLLTEFNSCTHADAISTLLRSCLEYIEILESEAEIYDKTISDAQIIAQFIYNCEENESSVATLAEYSALNNKTTKQQLDSIKTALIQDQNDTISVSISSIRAMARILQRTEQFEDAVKLWAMAVKANSSKGKNGKPTWKWWRAKYYFLLCSLNSNANIADIAHTVDVLLSSYETAPPPWNQKLQSLKQKCQISKNERKTDN
jgi:hypothetical protein